MNHVVSTLQLPEMSEAERTGMFQLRYEVFAGRLGWAVQTHDGLERDAFDDIERAAYIIAKSPGTEVDACWRLLPTVGPYMLSHTFPELLHGQPAPAAADIWELSRFAIASDRVATADSGFGPLSVALMAEAARFALANNIVRYVTVTTVAIERLLKRQGLHIHRIGPPIKIGVVLTVACIIEVDEITLRAVQTEEPEPSLNGLA
ncbi:acyl-homoserine-lactone synthase [Variovorax terrae]|uniref:Acyl-homoserine-lactone synthase n=1 Tax=Variovorax terrae TaxID=2923278 RepID=A0A9X2ANX4_9BURK|nr:acyl-homoserine-lactone synthase [Variovorax terrae]MCJ0765288.1 GNAT family N-acetyltransferase [Variovorax terrae]